MEFAVTSVFSWQNSVSLCPASFCRLEKTKSGRWLQLKKGHMFDGKMMQLWQSFYHFPREEKGPFSGLSCSSGCVVCNLILSSHSIEDIGKVHIIPTVEETEAQRVKKCVQGHTAPVCLTAHPCYFHHIMMIPKDSWRPSLLNAHPPVL